MSRARRGSPRGSYKALYGGIFHGNVPCRRERGKQHRKFVLERTRARQERGGEGVHRLADSSCSHQLRFLLRRSDKKNDGV